MDKDSTLFRQFIHNIAVMDDFTAHVNWRAKCLERNLDDVDGANDACAEAARFEQKNPLLIGRSLAIGAIGDRIKRSGSHTIIISICRKFMRAWSPEHAVVLTQLAGPDIELFRNRDQFSESATFPLPATWRFVLPLNSARTTPKAAISCGSTHRAAANQCSVSYVAFLCLVQYQRTLYKSAFHSFAGFPLGGRSEDVADFH
jgi:hypothetical protein